MSKNFVIMRVFSVIILLAFFIKQVNSAPLSYSEFAMGDIASGSTTFSLGFGVNRVAGTVSGNGSPFGTDFDKFNVSLPASSVLVSLDLLLGQGSGGNGLFASSMEIIASDVYRIFTSAGGFFTIPIGIETDFATFIGLNSLPSGMVNNYLITLNVSPVSVVPIPAALPLFGTGIGILGYFGWRKKRRRTALAA